MSKESAGGGLTLGSVIATYLSWITNHSLVWCIVHFFCGWFYIFYWLLTYYH